jgi:hypothetical protein
MGRDHPEMAASTDVGLIGFLAWGRGAGGLTDRLSEGDEVVAGGRRRTELAVMPYEIPAAGRREAARV